MRAHGFTDDQLMKLERLGIVAKITERVVSGLQTFQVVRLKIREADHQVVGSTGFCSHGEHGSEWAAR